MIFVSANYSFGGAPLDMPTGFAAGDLLLLNEQWGTFLGGGLVAPAGWTLLGVDTSGVPRHLMAYRIATGSETSLTIPTDSGGHGGIGSVAAYRAAGSSIPVTSGNWAEATAGPSGVPQTLTMPAITVPGSAFIIASFAIQNGSGGSLALSAGTGWTLNDSLLGTLVGGPVNAGFLWEQSPTRLAGSVLATMQETCTATSFWWGQALAVNAAGNRLTMLV